MASVHFPINCADCSEFENWKCGLTQDPKSHTQKCSHPDLAERWSVESRAASNRVHRVMEFWVWGDEKIVQIYR